MTRPKDIQKLPVTDQSRIIFHLNAFGVIAQAPVLGIGLGAAGVTDGGPDDAVEAAEDGLGPPEAPEGEDGGSRWLVRGAGGRVGDPIGEPDALGAAEERSEDDGEGQEIGRRERDASREASQAGPGERPPSRELFHGIAFVQRERSVLIDDEPAKNLPSEMSAIQ